MADDGQSATRGQFKRLWSLPRQGFNEEPSPVALPTITPAPLPTWPAALPQDFQIDGYGETLPDVVIRTKMDAGPAKVRRRFTTNVRPIKCKLKVTDTQYIALASFFQNDCAGGALSFTWNIADPVLVALFPALIVDVVNGIVQLTLRFTAPPMRSVLTGADAVPGQMGVSGVDLQFEVMP